MLYPWKIEFIRVLIIKLFLIHKSDYFTHRIHNINLFFILIFSNVVEFYKSLATKISESNSNKNIFIITLT